MPRSIAVAESNDLQSFLSDRAEPCPWCGYNLRGLTGPVCPECGVGLRMGIVADRKRWPWMRTATNPALFIGAAIMVGVAAMGWRGAGAVLVVWGAAIVWMRVRAWALRYYRAPVEARGDLLWRAWVIVVVAAGWLIGTIFALGAVVSGV